MSLCGELRSEAVTLRQHDLTNCARAHRDSLRALLAVHAVVAHNTSPALLANADLSKEPALQSEVEFLDNYDLTRGRSFDASKLVLPFPLSSPGSTDSSLSSLPNGAAQSGTASSGDNVANRTPVPADLKPKTGAASSVTIDADGASGAPSVLAPPQPEDQANLSESALRVIDQRRSQTPAKTVHLPPEEVQEQRRREIAEERAKHAKAHRPSVPQLHAPAAEVPSSPSSTIGPLSAATPGPPEESPDTSPDSERPDAEEILPPEDLRPSPEEQRAKEQHDRLHAAQMAIARAQARGDVETPDDQLKWEEQEAAAREAEEQSARDERAGPEPGVTKDHAMTEALEQEMEQRRARALAAVESGKGTPQSANEAEPAAKQAQAASAAAALPTGSDDPDNIVVTRRQPTAGAVQSSKEKPVAPAKPPASGSKLSRKFSEVNAKRPFPSQLKRPTDTPARSSPEPVSPHTQGQPTVVSPAQLMRSPPVPARTRAPRVPGSDPNGPAMSALEKLTALKGAASDPDNDYLVPLFRIQAHDSPNNSFSRSLADLVRMAPKALSTEDHFTQSNERIDFRMLRRIYQLQNANKWSLRQMDKAKEPEPQVTHHDHMMAEMKWMRKDFQAERKMKRSVCAWLAQRCAQWVAASPEERQKLQVRVKKDKRSRRASSAESVPELDHAEDSAPEDNSLPDTPVEDAVFTSTLVVAPELLPAVEELSRSGKLSKALDALPATGITQDNILRCRPPAEPMAAVSKFVHSKVLPTVEQPSRKRSRYAYEDEEETLESHPALKRIRAETINQQETSECALFHPDNKQIRDRLRTNTSFRPPSEFLMPSATFYEQRIGSQWTWEDDQKLRKLAKDYSFNWSLIADEMTLPGGWKSSYDRRTPWECFERWVELESLPADMKRTIYFKTWLSRLESSAQSAERRYQAQLAHYQQQAQQSGTTPREIQRRKPTPSRVEKRRTTRYLWVIDGCRKIARKREQQLFKFSEAARAAAQRKPQADNNPQRQLLTPQEISKKRHQQDVAAAAAVREQRQKLFEQQQRLMQARLAQQQAQQQAAQQQAQQQQAQQAQQQNPQQQQQPPNPNQQPGQQPHPGQQAAHGQQQRPVQNMAMQQGQMPVQQQVANMNGMAAQQAQQQAGRTAVPIAAHNGRIMVPQINGKPIQQASMQQLQQLAQAGRLHFAPGQPFNMPNGNMASPNGMTPQQLQHQQALIAAYAAQMQQQAANNGGQAQGQQPNGTGVPNASGSPNMPPPPNPQQPQQLSSGHVPQIIQIKNQLRANNPNISDEQLTQIATQQMQLKNHPQANSHQLQARQNAMNAAAGITTAPQAANMQAYANGQQNGYAAQNGMPNGTNGVVANGENGTAPQVQMPPGMTAASQQAYAQKMWQRQMAQMRQSPNAAAQMRQSPNAQHARLAGSSPNVAHASPNMAPASPQMQYPANMAAMAAAGVAGARPPSRSATPQMQRLGSNGSVPGAHPGIPSPGSLPQNSPRNMQASMAR